MSKGWSEERRKQQAERCRANKPWKKSTGPKTPAGKARSSMNAFKHGGDAMLKTMVREMLKHNRDFLLLALAVEEIKLKKMQEKQARTGGHALKNRLNEVKGEAL